MSLYYLILWNQVDILQKHFKKDHVHMRLWTRFYGTGLLMGLKFANFCRKTWYETWHSDHWKSPVAPPYPIPWCVPKSRFGGIQDKKKRVEFELIYLLCELFDIFWHLYGRFHWKAAVTAINKSHLWQSSHKIHTSKTVSNVCHPVSSKKWHTCL